MTVHILAAVTVAVGALNPAVTQQNIDQTICRSGWTKTARPPVSFTNALKAQQLTAAGIAASKASRYEEDHLVPLELGGAPQDPANLWPQLWPDARRKDVVETALHRAVCRHRVPLAAARNCMIANWHSCTGLLK